MPAQCKALVSYGNTWTAGRKRCTKNTTHPSGLCGTHRKQEERREAQRADRKAVDAWAKNTNQEGNT